MLASESCVPTVSSKSLYFARTVEEQSDRLFLERRGHGGDVDGGKLATLASAAIKQKSGAARINYKHASHFSVDLSLDRLTFRIVHHSRSELVQGCEQMLQLKIVKTICAYFYCTITGQHERSSNAGDGRATWYP